MADNTPPAVPSTFRWVVDPPWGLLLECAPLAGAARHGWTTRQVEFRPHDAGSATSWGRLADAVGLPPGAIVALDQVHGASVVEALPGQRARGDGLISGNPDLLLTVRAADCVPLLIADPRTGAAAAVHAGWRGTCLGIAGAAVARLADAYGARGCDLIAAAGPSIGPCCYRVGSELMDAFGAEGHAPDRIASWFGGGGDALSLDLWRANRDQLIAAGVSEASVHVAGLCTACHPAWLHSYRRDGPAAGRLVGFIRSARNSRAR